MAIYNPQGFSSPSLQGSSPQLQASSGSGLRVQPAPTNSAHLLQPSVSPQQGVPQTLVGPVRSAPAPNNGGSQPGGNVSAAPAPVYVDPYADWGGKANYDRLVAGFNTQDQNIHSTSKDAASNAAIGRHSSILDFLDSLRSGQRGVDERGVQNELAKKQGYNSIISMVGRGLRSGGTMLANKNALSSSAAQAIAMAYGDIGGRELNKVGNQYELENRNIGIAQQDVNQQKSTGLRKFGESEVQSVNAIVDDARNKLASLDASIAGANLPQRIQIEQEKQQIHNEVQGILSQYDTELNQGAAGVNPTSTEARRSTAFGLANAGVAATNPFDFSTEVPTQLQNTGPFNGELPIFSTFRGKRQTV